VWLGREYSNAPACDYIARFSNGLSPAFIWQFGSSTALNPFLSCISRKSNEFVKFGKNWFTFILQHTHPLETEKL